MWKKPGIKTYLVGGAVGYGMHKEPKDRDYVVGATPEYMISNNFKTVGADSRCFASRNWRRICVGRGERKTGIGYQGFSCDFSLVTLKKTYTEGDIRMNAIALIEETGEYIDPYGGIQDIKDGVIRRIV